jgi:hypothetical protein
LELGVELQKHSNPPIQKVDKNLRKPSEYFKSNIYVDTMGPSAIGLKAMIEVCGADRVLFGTDFGPVPMSPKLHIDLVDDTITDAGDRKKIFSPIHLPCSVWLKVHLASLPELLSFYARAPWELCGVPRGEVA